MLENHKAQKFDNKQSVELSEQLVNIYKKRRTIREFSQELPDIQILKNAIAVAGTAPSGANRQPWHFSLIHNTVLKSKIRELAEKEEYDFYHKRPNRVWLDDLKHLHTNDEKKFLEQAPYLVVIFYKNFDQVKDQVKKNYYAKESVGIATGMLISVLHLAGLSILTYTPKRMQFLKSLLGREEHERAFMVLGVGLPAGDAQVPVIEKKSLDCISDIYS